MFSLVGTKTCVNESVHRFWEWKPPLNSGNNLQQILMRYSLLGVVDGSLLQGKILRNYSLSPNQIMSLKEKNRKILINLVYISYSLEVKFCIQLTVRKSE
jgi:hypothetical protein